MATPTTLPATFVAGNVLTAAQMNDLRGAFRVLQVVSTTKTDVFSASSITAGTVTDVTGLSATITPSATSSKILVAANVNASALLSSTYYAYNAIQLKRGSTAIGGGTTAGNRKSLNAILAPGAGSVDSIGGTGFVYLDSPNTTSATTYQIAIMNVINATVTILVNQMGNDTDAAYYARLSSSITVMEISA